VSTARTIEKLDPKVAIQIAAGEVVTRPSSVAKELLENSIDAGAGRVRVEVDGGGVDRLAIIDDGRGMSREDATACIERHATSKLRAVDELSSLASFGFRGEALPSIASVSRLRIQTRHTGEDEGTEVIVEGGADPMVRPCGCAVGTTVEVADLFYNVPARRKFLRATSTEGAHVTEVVKAVALAHPGVQLELHRGNRRALRYLPTDDRGRRTREVLDGYPLIDATGRRGHIEVEAYLSAPDRSRSGAGGLYLFVLGRPVQDRALSRAVAQAYAGALTPGRYPVGALFVTLPRSEVDINVHPQKSEVRFAREREVVDAVFQVVGDAIAPKFIGKRSAVELDADRSIVQNPQNALSWKKPRDDEPAPQDTTWAAPAQNMPVNQSSAETEPVQSHLSWRAPSLQVSPEQPPSDQQTRPRHERPKPDGTPEPGPSLIPAPQLQPAPRDAPPSPAPSTPKPPESPTPLPKPPAPNCRWLGTERGVLIAVGANGLRLIPRKRAVSHWFSRRGHAQLERSGALLSRPLPSPLVLRRSPAICQRIGEASTLAAAKRLGLIVTRTGASAITAMAVPDLLHGLTVEPLTDALLQEALRNAPPAEAIGRLARHAAQAEPRLETFDAVLVEALEQHDLLDEVTAQVVPLHQ